MTKLISFTEECLVCHKSHIDEVEFIQCIEDNIDKVNWLTISRCQHLSEQFIAKYHDKVHWLTISKCQHLSNEFMDKYHNKIYWWTVSHYQQLSEQIIEKYHDNVHWWLIPDYQNFSKEFIEKVLMKIIDPVSEPQPHIKKYVTEIRYDIETAIERNKYSQQYKKHILTILQEDKITLTEKFKNELLTLILKDM
jgi:hypothetical protein